MTVFHKLCLCLLFAASNLMAVDAPPIRGGYIVKSFKSTSRKIKWIKDDKTHMYRAPKPGRKFVFLYVLLNEGFSISTDDYVLSAQGKEYECLSVTGIVKGKESNPGENKKLAVVNKGRKFVKLIFSVATEINNFDIVFKLPSTIPQKTIKQWSFAYPSSEKFTIPETTPKTK